MAVDSNFERLEEKLNHLVDVLAQLQQENGALKGRADSLEAENAQIKSECARLRELEGEYQEASRNRDEVRSRIEQILARLDEVEF